MTNKKNKGGYLTPHQKIQKALREARLHPAASESPLSSHSIWQEVAVYGAQSSKTHEETAPETMATYREKWYGPGSETVIHAADPFKRFDEIIAGFCGSSKERK